MEATWVLEPEVHVSQWLTWLNSYKSLIQHFRLSVSQNEYSTNISKKSSAKLPKMREIKADFIFPSLSLWKIEVP